MPPALAYLWSSFSRMAARRSPSGFGASRLTWVEIDAYQRLFRLRFAPWEIELIERLDDTQLMSDHDKPEVQ